MSGGGWHFLAPINAFSKFGRTFVSGEVVHFGFTLAEVLVTLGIIGVISAMTIPTLMQNHQRKTYVTQLHKVYNQLNQALLQYQTDKNAVNLSEAGLISSGLSNFFKTYFNVVQDCGSDGTPCFADSYRKLSGVKSDFLCLSDCVVLADGTAIGLASSNKDNIIQLSVDINGAQGPNIFGRDAFALFIYQNNGVIDDLVTTTNDADVEHADWDYSVSAPLTKEQREKNFESACLNNTSAHFHGCFGKILNDNWEMNY